jgi:hypothetical protein
MTTRRAFQSLAHWGAFTAHVEDGRLVGVSPFAEDPQPSPLIEAWPEMVYAENRIRKPSIRRGWLETVGRGLPHPGHGRGDDTFVEVSWDEALGHVQRELERVRREHGNPSIFGGSYGWSSAGRLHHARTLIHRFMASIGGCTGQVTNYSYGAAMRLLPHVLGDMAAVAGPRTLRRHRRHRRQELADPVRRRRSASLWRMDEPSGVKRRQLRECLAASLRHGRGARRGMDPDPPRHRHGADPRHRVARS